MYCLHGFSNVEKDTSKSNLTLGTFCDRAINYCSATTVIFALLFVLLPRGTKLEYGSIRLVEGFHSLALRLSDY